MRANVATFAPKHVLADTLRYGLFPHESEPHPYLPEPRRNRALSLRLQRRDLASPAVPAVAEHDRARRRASRLPIMRSFLIPLLLALTTLLAACDGNQPGGVNEQPPALTHGVTSITPSNVLPGDTIVIEGRGFGVGEGTISFGRYELPPSSVTWSEERITAEIPERAGSGPLEVAPVSGDLISADTTVHVIAEFVAFRLVSDTVEPGATLPEPFRVRLTDTNGDGVPGEPLEFFGGGIGARFEPRRTETNEDGYAESHLTLASEPGNYNIVAQGRCPEGSSRCGLRAEAWYDNTTPRHHVLGYPLILEGAGGTRVPGWLDLTETSGGSHATILTSNHRPGLPDSLTPANLRTSPTPAIVTPPEPTEVLIAYRDDVVTTHATRSSLRRSLGLANVGTTAGGKVEVARIPQRADMSEVLERLNADPRVRIAEPNYHLALTPLPDDPYLHEQWGPFAVGAPVAWHNETGDTNPVTVAIIDSGVDLEHPDLAARLLPGYDFCGDDTIECEATDANPQVYDWWGNRHGTHVAGIVGATINDQYGTAGIAPTVRLLPIKVFPDNASGVSPMSVTITALRWAAGLPVDGIPINPNPADVINLSLGGAFTSEIFQEALDDVHELGIVIVAATGNETTEHRVHAVNFPAAAAGVIAVGALDDTLERAYFSNYGVGPYGPDGVDLVAPGHFVNSTMPRGWGEMSGTSMAAPHVAAAAALLLAQDPTRTPDEIEAALKASAYFDPAYMTREEYGAGLLRVDGVLGVPAPTSPTDRHAQIRIDAGPTTVSGTLDLLTGTSATLDLGVLPTGVLLTVTLEHEDRAFASTTEP